MLDQSLSAENFKKIFEIENRKGGFNKKFYSDSFNDLSRELTEKRKEISDYKANENPEYDDPSLITFYEEKNLIEERKNKALERCLVKFSTEVNTKQFRFKFNEIKHKQSEKKVYIVGKKDASSYFSMKQLQYNINRTFSVKQSNRHHITKQLQMLLKDNYPKIIVRTDIKSFYESIPQYVLLDLILNNQLLSSKSKLLIKQALYSYNNITGQLVKPEKVRKGIPRGLGLSAYLSELFLKQLDKKISNISGVSYYARYVDDIIIVFMPDWKKNKGDYIKQIREKVEILGVYVNEIKTKEYDCTSNKKYIIDFLGYQFIVENSKYTGTYLSENKKAKYRERLEKSIDDYLRQEKYTKKEAYKLLIHRFNYLTKNTKLYKPKRGVIGIYYSNSILDDKGIDLDYLDLELEKLIDNKLPVANFPKLNLKLKSFSFKDGFFNRRYFHMSSKRKLIKDLRPEYLKPKGRVTNMYERITSIWK